MVRIPPSRGREPPADAISMQSWQGKQLLERARDIYIHSSLSSHLSSASGSYYEYPCFGGGESVDLGPPKINVTAIIILAFGLKGARVDGRGPLVVQFAKAPVVLEVQTMHSTLPRHGYS